MYACVHVCNVCMHICNVCMHVCNVCMHACARASLRAYLVKTSITVSKQLKVPLTWILLFVLIFRVNNIKLIRVQIRYECFVKQNKLFQVKHACYCLAIDPVRCTVRSIQYSLIVRRCIFAARSRVLIAPGSELECTG